MLRRSEVFTNSGLKWFEICFTGDGVSITSICRPWRPSTPSEGCQSLTEPSSDLMAPRHVIRSMFGTHCFGGAVDEYNGYTVEDQHLECENIRFIK